MTKETGIKTAVTTTLGSVLALTSAQATGILAGIPAHITSGFSNPWDIDGDGTDDFTLAANASYNGNLGILAAGTNGLAQGTNNRVVALTGAQLVGSAYGFRSYGSMLFSSSALLNYFGLQDFAPNTTETIGFRFNRGGNTHYAVAEFTFEFTLSSAFLNLSNVRWNSTPGASIAANSVAVPEPANAGAALATLAAGAAGLRRWRRQNQA